MTFVEKLGPWSADETREGNGEMCVSGREGASEVKEEEEKALEVATGALLPPL